MLRFRLAFLAALLVPSLALAQAGRVLMAVGDVVAVRGAQELRLGPGAAVESGDTIRLGPNSNAQIRMSDQSIISLRERTVFRIDEYVFSGQVDGREKSLFSLLAGGMRTVTGIIGNLRRTDKYAVRTPTSTIGIRGTHYTLRECQNDCFEAGGGATASAPIHLASAAQSDAGPLAQLKPPVTGKPAPNGTYGGVTDGRIGVVNNVADQEFGANQYFFVADRNTPPQGLLAPPGFLHDRLEGQKRTSGQKGKETGEALAQGGINAESRPSDVPAGPKPSDFIVTERRDSSGNLTVVSAAPTIGAVGAWVQNATDEGAGGALLTKSALTLDANGFPTAFNVPDGCIGPNSDCVGGASGTLGAPVQSGSAAPTGSTDKIFWGAWASGTIVDRGPGGGTLILSSTNQAHLMYGQLTPAEVIAAKTGMVMYTSTFPGFGTVPTNNLGQTATGGTFPTITMNFTARTANFSSASVNFPAQNWSFVGGSAAIMVVPGQGAFFGGLTTGSCSGSCGATVTARAAGIFLGPLGDHAGVAYSGKTTSGTPANFSSVRVYCTSGC